MKKFLCILSIILILSDLGTAFSECKISGKIEECNSALKRYTSNDGTWITPGASIRDIEEFVCLQASPEKRAFQIAMGENFESIDDEMEKYLDSLEKSKNFYFGKDAQYSYLDGINHISSKMDYFKAEYYKACSDSITDVMECIENPAYSLPEERPSITIAESSQFFEGSGGNCYTLTDTKIDIAKQVAYNVFILNKQQVAKDEKKLYDQEVRTKYDKVVDLMMINIGYIERVRRKWPSKTKNAY